LTRRRRDLAPRKPHPDPRTEAELQRIISLQNAITRKEAALDGDHADLRKLDRTIARHPTWDGHNKRIKQAQAIRDRIGGLEQEISPLRADIAKRTAALSDTALAYL